MSDEIDTRVGHLYAFAAGFFFGSAVIGDGIPAWVLGSILMALALTMDVRNNGVFNDE